MKSAILTTLIASAAAFAPTVQQSKTLSSALNADAMEEPAPAAVATDFTGEVGAQAPLGFWDPMSFLGAGEQTRFDRLREVEIKHGRISMLAVVGNLVTYSGTRLEGMEDMPSGFAALSPSAWANNPVAKSQIYGMVLTFAFLEFFVMKDQFGTAESPGDYRNGVGVTVWDKFDDKTKQRKRAIEINNGRAAQMGILGLMVHEKMGNIADILPGASS